MTWHEFGWFALPAVVLWLAAGTVVYTKAVSYTHLRAHETL